MRLASITFVAGKCLVSQDSEKRRCRSKRRLIRVYGSSYWGCSSIRRVLRRALLLPSRAKRESYFGLVPSCRATLLWKKFLLIELFCCVLGSVRHCA